MAILNIDGLRKDVRFTMVERISNRKHGERLRKLIAGIFTTALFVFTESPGARAAEDSYGGFDHYFHVDHLEIGPDQCVAEATIDYDGVLSNMSSIRDEWLSADKSLEFYQRHTLEIIFGVIDHKAGGVLLQMVYDKSIARKPDKCQFNLNMAKIDDFGQIKLFKQLSWSFNASLASRIVWDKFDDRNLPKIALNYKFSQEADRLLQQQNGQRVPAPPTNVQDRPKSCDDIMALDVAEAFNNSPYAQGRHLKVIDATNPTPLPPRPNRGFACISKLVTNGGILSVFVEPKLLNGKWYVSVDRIPQ